MEFVSNLEVQSLSALKEVINGRGKEVKSPSYKQAIAASLHKLPVAEE